MRLMRKTYAAVALLGATALSSCGDEVADRGDPGDERTAAGEVRGGTISDDMLPLDSVQSQSPSLGATGSAGPSQDDGDATESDAPVSEEESAEPAATAEAAPSGEVQEN